MKLVLNASKKDSITVEKDGKVIGTVKEVILNGTFTLEQNGKVSITVQGFNPAVTIDVDPRIVDSSK